MITPRQWIDIADGRLFQEKKSWKIIHITHMICMTRMTRRWRGCRNRAKYPRGRGRKRSHYTKILHTMLITRTLLLEERNDRKSPREDSRQCSKAPQSQRACQRPKHWSWRMHSKNFLSLPQ